MLQDTTIEQIATLLKVDPATFKAAVKSDKEEIVEISDKLTVFDEQELDKFQSNKYEHGKKVAIEMAVKDFRKEKGLDFEGKTLDSLVEAATKKAMEDAKIEVPEQVKTIQQRLDKVREEYKKLELSVTEKDKLIVAAASEASLYREVPTLGDGFLPVNKMTTLMKADGYEFINENGKMVASLNGEVVTDKTGSPLPLKDVMVSYSEQNKLHTLKSDTPPPPIGRGAGGTGGTPTTFSKRSEVDAYFKEQGKSIQGKEYMDTIRSIKKDNPDFNINE